MKNAIDKNDLLESVLEPLGDISEVVLVPENLADEELLAVDIVIIKLLINLLEHGDPLKDVNSIEVIAKVSGPKMRNKSNDLQVVRVLPNILFVLLKVKL